ncbi:hypothetical protein [Paenibacillus sp. FJAT-26967]|uniref:hypothetical protein n=1 Tax=Paenibacillus sp. FJAT-26967 TaxID=1729690 RepID=UPI000AC4B584|nr:hypothetical protein [Paenibacillus sp. FJAT-26967]
MEKTGYTFAELHGKEHLVDEIRQLENRLKEETGETITLIAYEKEDAGYGKHS